MFYLAGAAVKLGEPGDALRVGRVLAEVLVVGHRVRDRPRDVAGKTRRRIAAEELGTSLTGFTATSMSPSLSKSPKAAPRAEMGF